MRDRFPSFGLRPGLIAAAAGFILIATFSFDLRLRAQPGSTEVRALWVVHPTLSSPDAIGTMVDAAGAAGFNTLLVQVRGAGETFETALESPRASSLPFDPLAETIARARSAGLKVHAWINLNLASEAADLPIDRDHVVYRHPEWLMVPQALADDLVKVDPRSPQYLGRLARYVRADSSELGGLYLSPVTAAAVEYSANYVRDLVSRYAVDGVHLDYARYPRQDFDYSRDALAAFRRSVVDSLAPPDQAAYDRRLPDEPAIYAHAFPEEWQSFRIDHLTRLVSRIREVVSAARPGALLSAAVMPDIETALATTFQDWRSWLERGLIDVVCPMPDTGDAALFATQVATARQVAGRHPLWAGIGASRLSQTEIVTNVQAARRLGVGGVILFSYDSLTGPSRGTEYLAQLGRAAFMQ